MHKITEDSLHQQIRDSISFSNSKSDENLTWLKKQMHHYFFLSNKDAVEAIAALSTGLHSLEKNRKITLVDRDKILMQAQLGVPGSLYEALRTLPERDISFAQINTSYASIPGTSHPLEVLRFDFDRKEDQEVAKAEAPSIPQQIISDVRKAMLDEYPDFDLKKFDKRLGLLWLNSENYVLVSPAERVARILWLYQQTQDHEGIYFDVQETEGPDGSKESRILFGVGNPPQKGFLQQTIEVFKRLEIGVKRAYCLTVSNGIHPYFLATFYVKTASSDRVEKGSRLYQKLREELYNTQILPASSRTYRRLVARGIFSGADATLIRAFIGFCHTSLAHNHPDRFDLEGVMRAFYNHADLVQQLVKLFRIRFDPEIQERQENYCKTLEKTVRLIEHYNTGRHFLDEYRRTIFLCCLSFIQHTLKTNFFVPEKHALAFRIDPAYLDELDEEFTADLPPERPFRVTYFSGHYGSGYHIGFSDIARGGWRTLITQGRDDYVMAANSIFKENYILAHTQHLKNKDIYEGGSKMVAVLDAGGEKNPQSIRQRLYKLQFGFINAFLDIYVTENGKPKDPRVIDYYGEDEPIELGPDENMHDSMVELIARKAEKRGYLLGKGIMSSKEVGINHKEFGVTSIGVVKFAEVALQELGVDMHRDPFTVKFTGGPNGDVAGNAMKLLLERCPEVQIKLIIDGTGALYDPQGSDREALSRIVLQEDVDAFDPAALHPGGFILYRLHTRKEGMRQLYKKIVCTELGLEELWVSNDEFYREFNNLIFSVPADLFIPAGGRPETVDTNNCHRMLSEDGAANTRVIVEGANSFITPEARIELQKMGIVIIRDASANKCGVISSSYEIIANLLLSDEEFLANKESYVADVIEILNGVSEDEARLIFKRHRELSGTIPYTEISSMISNEINAHHARLFKFFQTRPELCEQPEYQNAILYHLPSTIAQTERFRKRISTLPSKIRSAMLAGQIASSLVYIGDEEAAYKDMIESHLAKLPDASGLTS